MGDCGAAADAVDRVGGQSAPLVSRAKARPTTAISPRAATEAVASPRLPSNQEVAMAPAVSGPSAVTYRPTLLHTASAVARTLGGNSSGA